MYVLVDSFVAGCTYLVPPCGLIVDPEFRWRDESTDLLRIFFWFGLVGFMRDRKEEF